MKSKKPARIAQKRRSPRPPIARLEPGERRKRQLRRAAKRYREKQRKRRARGLGRRKAPRCRDVWTLPPDPVPGRPGTPTGGVYEMAVEPEPEESPKRRRPPIKRQAVRLPPYVGPDGIAADKPVPLGQAFDERGRRRVRINGKDYVVGGGLLDKLDKV